MKFFAAIRLMLARASGPDLLNAMAHDIINKYILPPLRKEAEGEGVEAMEARELAEMYEDYTKNHPRAKIFGVQAFKTIRAVVGRYGLGEDELDDFVMELVEDIYNRKTYKTFRTVDEGPESFAKWLTRAAQFRARNNSRQLTTRKRMVHLPPRGDDDANPIERMPDEGGSPIEVLIEKEVQQNLHRDLRQFIKRRFGRKPAHMALFTAWMKATVKYGTRLNVRQQLLPRLSDRLGVPEKTLYGYMSEMKREMGKFFLKEYNLRVPFRASDGASIVDRLVYAEYRRKIAGWVLPQSLIFRMTLEA